MAIREEIISTMREFKEHQRRVFGEMYHPRYSAHCTWWFKSRINYSTAEVRRELLRMEKDGIVTADRRQSNNTKWILIEESTQERQP